MIIIVSSVLIGMILLVCLVNSIFDLIHLKEKIEITNATVIDINKMLNDGFIINN